MVNSLINEYLWFVKLDKTLIYNKAAVNQSIFIRDIIARKACRNCQVFVISTHYSKSCILPVYLIKLNNGITCIIRGNFYDYKISIISDYPISISNESISNKKDISSCYCEGFKDEWVFKFNISNFKNTTIEIYDKYDLFLLFHELNKIQKPSNILINDIFNKNQELLKEKIQEACNNHKRFNDYSKQYVPRSLYEIFPKTDYAITDYDFCINNNLGSYLNHDNEIDDFINRILKYTDFYNIFINEYNNFIFCENFDNKDMKWKNDYDKLM